MSKSAVVTRDERSGENLNIPTPDEIRQQLGSILASPPFHGSKRCHQFLEYVCEQALAGEVGALKERTIAIAVFGRQPQSDLGEDTIVRVGAREVRKRLAQYYVTPDGAASPVLIELPPGSYAPEFRYAALPAEPKSTVHVEIQPAIDIPSLPAPPARQLRRWRSYAILSAAVVLAGAVAYVRWTVPDVRTAAFQRFWAPVFHNTDPLLIGVGHPIVYQPSHRAAVLSAGRQPESAFPVQRPLDLAPNEIDGSD